MTTSQSNVCAAGDCSKEAVIKDSGSAYCGSHALQRHRSRVRNGVRTKHLERYEQ